MIRANDMRKLASLMVAETRAMAREFAGELQQEVKQVVIKRYREGADTPGGDRALEYIDLPPGIKINKEKIIDSMLPKNVPQSTNGPDKFGLWIPGDTRDKRGLAYQAWLFEWIGNKPWLSTKTRMAEIIRRVSKGRITYLGEKL